MKITIDTDGRMDRADDAIILALRVALDGLKERGDLVNYDLRWTDSLNVGHVDLPDDGTIEATARRFIARLVHAGITAGEAETFTVIERDHALGVAAWSGIEDSAWNMAIEYLRRPMGGTWILISGVRHDGRCPRCLTHMRFELDPDHWVCDHCSIIERPHPHYLEIGR